MTVKVVNTGIEREGEKVVMSSGKRASCLEAGNCAFIGRIHTDDDPYELYLITYSAVVKANNFRKTWDTATFYVREFIDDVTISYK